MEKEIEIRFQINEENKKDIFAFISKGSFVTKEKHQIDEYYCEAHLVDEGKTGKRAFVVRIRREDTGSAIAYKEFSGETSWIEIESGIEKPELVAQILKRLHLKPFVLIDKKRVSVKINDIEINVDEIKDLGTFVELEIMHEDENEGKQRLNNFLKNELNISDAMVIEKGYVQLMEKAKE